MLDNRSATFDICRLVHDTIRHPGSHDRTQSTQRLNVNRRRISFMRLEFLTDEFLWQNSAKDFTLFDRELSREFKRVDIRHTGSLTTIAHSLELSKERFRNNGG